MGSDDFRCQMMVSHIFSRDSRGYHTHWHLAGYSGAMAPERALGCAQLMDVAQLMARVMARPRSRLAFRMFKTSMESAPYFEGVEIVEHLEWFSSSAMFSNV